MSTMGTRVRELRQARGLSQQAIAGDGLSAGYVSLIESGKRTPSPATVERLAERLGVPVSQLLGEERPAVSEHARLEVNFARLALANGNPADALRCLGAIRLDELDSGTACDAALVLAESLQETGQLDRAVAVLESLVDRCRREECWLKLALAATVLTVMYLESGDVSRAVENGLAAMKETEAAGLEGSDEHVRLGAVLVWALVERGDLLYATRRVEDLIDVANRLGSSRARGSVYWNAAVVANERGQVTEALRLTERAMALLSDQEDSRDLPRLRLNYALLLLNSPVPHAVEALHQLDQAESDPMLAASELDLGTAATFRGRAHLLLGELDDAAEHAARALQILGPSEHVERASALLLLGDVGTAQLDMDLAQESYRETGRVLVRMKRSRKVARLWHELGDSWRDLGDLTHAVEAYDQSFHTIGFTSRQSARAESVRTGRGAHSVTH